MQRIKVTTLFNITQTNTTGRYRPDGSAFTDAAGNHIADFASWNYSRNCQRNLETIIQILSLRTHISDIATPLHEDNTWSFRFTVDTVNAYGPDLSILVADIQDVPMIPLSPGTDAIQLIPSGDHQNIWIEVIP